MLQQSALLLPLGLRPATAITAADGKLCGSGVYVFRVAAYNSLSVLSVRPLFAEGAEQLCVRRTCLYRSHSASVPLYSEVFRTNIIYIW